MIVKRFRDRIIKRMRNVPHGILLIFLAPIPGERGERLIVSQVEWDEHGSETYAPNMSLAQLRQKLREK